MSFLFKRNKEAAKEPTTTVLAADTNAGPTPDMHTTTSTITTNNGGVVSNATSGVDPSPMSASPPAVSPPQPIVTTTQLRQQAEQEDSSSPRSHSGAPVFHSYTPSSRGVDFSSGGSFTPAGGGAMLPPPRDEPTFHTPPSEELVSSHAAHPETGARVTAPIPTPTSSLVPPPLGISYGVLSGGAHLSSSGSMHQLSMTNMVMTPNPSLPSTPTLATYVPGVDTGAGHESHPAQPQRSPHTVARPLVFPATTAPHTAMPITISLARTSPSPSSSPPSVSTVPITGPPVPVPTTSDLHSVPSDEVQMLRAMFRAVPSLSRGSFQLGATLGTGTFGRVRIVSFVPPPSASTTSSTTSEESSTPSETDEPPVQPLYFALKMLKKSEIIRLKQVEHILAERAILSRIAHPFIVNLYSSFQDERYLYMTMEYVIGGELFSQLRKVGRFSNETSKFYAAEITLAIQYLHGLNTVYRDLKPENLLIDREGHIKITDFGFAKVVEDRTWTLCGTPEYLAPEIIQSKGHGKAVDWWALGILIFEMLAGYPPFYDENPFGIYQKILKGSIDFPKHVDPAARDLIRKLLTADRTKRFGCLQHGAEDIQNHAWFKGLDWDKVRQRRYKPPFVPAYRAPNDTSNFDRYPDSPEMTHQTPLTDKEKMLFKDF